MFKPLSREEHQILAKLQSDGRTTRRALSDHVGLAPSTTLDRVRELEDRQVIRGYHADVAPEALGRPTQAMVAIRISPKSKEVVDALVHKLWNLPETLDVFVVSGEDDVLVRLGLEDTQALQQVILREIATTAGVVEETTSLIFESRHKHVIEPVETNSKPG